MIEAKRTKEGGFIEYKHMLHNRTSLMDCLDMLQSFYNLTSGIRCIYARDSDGELIKMDLDNKPVYDFMQLSGCSVFSICGWSRDESCMLIMTIELGWRRVFLYSEDDIDSEKLFISVVHGASVLRERRRVLLRIYNGDKTLIEEARWCGVDPSVAGKALGSSYTGKTSTGSRLLGGVSKVLGLASRACDDEYE